MLPTWVVVADNSCARIFARDHQQKMLREIADLTRPAGRMSPAKRHNTERPGRSHDSRGENRHAMEPQTSLQEKELNLFVKHIIEFLDSHNKEFNDLIIVCAPKLLGLLRQHMDKSLTAKVTGEIRKDIAHLNINDISEKVFEKSLSHTD